MASTYDDLLAAVKSTVEGASLTIGGSSVTVRSRKLPLVRQALDGPPLVVVFAADDPESSEPFATGGYQLVSYLIQIVIVASSTSRDIAATSPDLLTARQAVRRLFQRPSPVSGLVTSAQVLQVEMLPRAPIARAPALAGYEFSALAVRFKCVESAA